ncbi:hypothetical protein HY032_01955 [Candidatus Gottesmanbacteria bacterium]|nr:hypothetical protein [Candidatus Gottesmanbacteria bacterium]
MTQTLPDMGTTLTQEPLAIHRDVPTQPMKARMSHVPLVAGGVIIIGLIVLYGVRTMLSTPNDAPVQVVETPTPSPTPIRVLSNIASQSAFVSLEQARTSLSGSLDGTNLDDPSLSPPVMDIPLGFAR